MAEALIRAVKTALRVKSDQFDDEIAALIDAAKADMRLSGVDKTADYDPLIQRAVILYSKAHFGYDDNAEKYADAYDLLKRSLSLAGDYHANG